MAEISKSSVREISQEELNGIEVIKEALLELDSIGEVWDISWLEQSIQSIYCKTKGGEIQLNADFEDISIVSHRNLDRTQRNRRIRGEVPYQAKPEGGLLSSLFGNSKPAPSLKERLITEIRSVIQLAVDNPYT